MLRSQSPPVSSGSIFAFPNWLLVLGALITAWTDPATSQSTAPPVARVLNLGGGAIVVDTVILTAAASSSSSTIAGIRFYVDGSPIGAEDVNSPYSTAWDTKTVVSGSHQIWVTARDANGLIGQSPAVTVTVQNVLDEVPNPNGLPIASHASLAYDVVYVRCPRGKPVAMPGASAPIQNYNGVNDLWLEASNNVYHQPGCDLVLHHSAVNYLGGIPRGDPRREDVLVNCNEDAPSAAICTVVDPNVSFDGRYVIYAKYEDTRTFATIDPKATGGWYPSGHSVTRVELELSADGTYTSVLKSFPVVPYAAPTHIYRYDLATRSEARVSPTDIGIFGARAAPNKSETWNVGAPVMDLGPFYLPDGRIAFTSNRNSGFTRFELFGMDADGRNLELISHRTMGQQLHGLTLKDGRILYTNKDTMLHKTDTNQYSLFTTNPDGSNPFIFAGKHDATHFSYHFATQASNGDVVVTLYYRENNYGLGALQRIPVDTPGPDFEHRGFTEGVWEAGGGIEAFAKPGEFRLTPYAQAGDNASGEYASASEFWIHPSGNRIITSKGKYGHPAAAPDNGLLVTYAIGDASTNVHYRRLPLSTILTRLGKDAGIWFIPSSGASGVGDVVTDARIVVDFPEYHEIMARPVASYQQIYGLAAPQRVAKTDSDGATDPRLPPGAAWGLTGAASLYDRETRSLNGTPWNMWDGGGVMSGRTYLNLAASGAELAVFGNEEVEGIRVLLPIPPHPNGRAGSGETFAGQQRHHMRVLGEFPVRKPGAGLDAQGNPDTSFIVRLPADTPFLFQTIDRRGMALDIETTTRTVKAGEEQLCSGCHVHTRVGIDPHSSRAKQDHSLPFADFTGPSAPLFAGFDSNGRPVVRPAREIYATGAVPGVGFRRSFEVDWRQGVSRIMAQRCAGCHAPGLAAFDKTGLRLDASDASYLLLVQNQYKPTGGTRITAKSKPGDGLLDVINDTPGTDRIVERNSCCTVSRWVSRNSARSSMLVWALYGARLDGRDPATGLPPLSSGVLVDTIGREHPEVWPRVGEHAAYVAGMSEDEKRLIARWIDLGAPYTGTQEDMMRPVMTITPVKSGDSVSRVLVGLWDDSEIDYGRFRVSHNGQIFVSGADLSARPEVIPIDLPVAVSSANADGQSFEFEVWDRPNRSYSVFAPGVAAANRTRVTLTGRALLRD